MSGFNPLLNGSWNLDYAKLARVPLQKNPAEWMYERLVRSIADFEKDLDNSQELGLRLVNFGTHETFHISDVGFWGRTLLSSMAKVLTASRLS